VITDVPGLRVGHWTDVGAATGCTVVLFPAGTVASAEVRGGAPATREVELLDPTRLVDRIDALVLTGGSAFGLAAADGVVGYCEEQGRGVATPAGRVPIVVALALFDLAVGDASVRPGAEQGRAACLAATAGPVATGRVGAGTGATVGAGPTPGPGDVDPGSGHADPGSGHAIGSGAGGSGSGPDSGGSGPADPGSGPGTGAAAPRRRPGGLVTATAVAGDLRVAALVAVNAFGVPGGDDAAAPEVARALGAGGTTVFGNTTIGLVATNAGLDKLACHLVAQGAHDGLARALFPAHTRVDGDAFVAAAVGGVDADVDAVRALAVHAVARAVGSLATWTAT
jgi:L-aminopeptidase/D-esterase-like protein